MVEDRLRRHFDYYLGKTEIVIYSVLAALLAVTAFVTIATAGQILWIGLSHWTVAAQTLRVLNQLLIVLMLVEILHTVRISIRSHVLVTEPFLVVGLIASIRRILVIYPGSSHSHQRRCMGDRGIERHFSLVDD